MSEIKLKPWTPDIDPETIPLDVMYSQINRVRGRLRTTYTGGVYWKKHNPDTSRCRCKGCMKKRAAAV